MKNNNPIPAGQYGLIYADPAWHQEMYSDKGYQKSPEMHYDTMTLYEMKAMRDEILFRTAPNAVCVMWSMWNMLDQAMELMTAWGFTYTTGMPWIKRTINGKNTFGTGYVLRGCTEPVLIGTHGKPRIKHKKQRGLLITDDLPDDIAINDLSVVIDTQRREHSRKPDEMIPLLEGLFDGPYLELFARTKRPGWAVWGNQTEKFAT